MTRVRITVGTPKGSCEYCGYPLSLLDHATMCEGLAFCTPSCASRHGSHDAHRRRLSDEERKAFYPATSVLGGQASVRSYAPEYYAKRS